MICGAGVLVWTSCLISAQDIWFDELFTVELAAKPIPELVKLASGDVHPPLYYIYVRLVYLLIHAFSSGGTVVTAAKISAVIPYVLIIIYALVYIKRRFGWLEAGMTVLLIETMPQLSQYMVEARMYSVCMFTLLAMFLHGFEAVSPVKKNMPAGRRYVHLGAAAVYGIISMYLHYYALIGAAAVGLCMFAVSLCSRKKLNTLGKDGASVAGESGACESKTGNREAGEGKTEESGVGEGQTEDREAGEGKTGESGACESKTGNISGGEENESAGTDCSLPVWIYPACMCVCLAAYIPWISTVLSQVGQVKASYWIQPVTIRTFPGCLKYIFKPDFESGNLSYACAGILILAYVIFLVRYIKIKGENRAYLICTLAVPVILVAAGVLASLLIRPVFVYRYMLPVLGIFWMGFACLFSGWVKDNMTNVTLKMIPAVIVAAVLIMTGVRDFNLFRWEEAKKINGMADSGSAIDMIREDYGDSLLVCNFNQVQDILWYYLDNDSVLWGETDETLIAQICGRDPIIMTDDTDELENLVRDNSGDSDGFIFIGSGNARDEILAAWEDRGMTWEEIADSCLIERYYFNVYRVDFE